jgi:isoamylase
MNAYWEPLSFELLPTEAGEPLSWRKCIDTAAAAPDDIQTLAGAPAVVNQRCTVSARSLVLLAARLTAGGAGASRG